jgi:hypothetical protein
MDVRGPTYRRDAAYRSGAPEQLPRRLVRNTGQAQLPQCCSGYHLSAEVLFGNYAGYSRDLFKRRVRFAAAIGNWSIFRTSLDDQSNELPTCRACSRSDTAEINLQLRL